MVAVDADTVALVGGVLCDSGDGVVSPVWRLTLATATWTADPFDAAGPHGFLAGLHDAAVVLDARGSALLLYGGIVAGNAQRSLWRYELASYAWNEVSEATLGERAAPSLASASATRWLLYDGGEAAAVSAVGLLVDVGYCRHAGLGRCAGCLAAADCVFDPCLLRNLGGCLPGTASDGLYVPALACDAHNASEGVESNASVGLVTAVNECPEAAAAPVWLVPVVCVVVAVIALVVIGSCWLDSRKARQRQGYLAVQ